MKETSIDILLIEDNPGDARLIQEMLREVKEVDWRIIHVDRLETGLDVLTTKPFDVCLLDLGLPDSSSDTTIAQIGCFFKLPILVMTGRDDAATGIQALQNGAQDYIVKGTVDGEGLARAIRYALERHNLEQRMGKLFDHANDAILVIDPEANSIIEANPKASVLLGYSLEEVLNHPLANFTGNYADKWERFLKTVQTKKSNQSIGLTLISQNQNEIQVDVSASLVDGYNETQIIAIIRDLTERKQLLKDLEFHANFNPITHIPNRQALDKQFRKLTSYKRLSDNNERLTLLYIDIDGFNRVNGNFGHEAGDELLREIAKKMRSVLRSHEMIAHLGSDEFAVLIPSKHARTSLGVAKRLKEAADTTYKLAQGNIDLTVSIGMAKYSGLETLGDMLNHANQAMYHAKRKHDLVFYSEEINEELQEWLWIERSFKTALGNNEFEIYFQPIIDLAKEQAIKAEALLRWPHAERGMISPGIFIPIVVEMGCMPSLDAWVIDKAISLASQGDFQVSVNISSQSLARRGFTSVVETALTKHNYPAHHLTLEVTERVLAHPREVLETLQELSNLGTKIAIDDFGTGYSSLSYLHEYPIESLKIDREFTKKLLDDDKAKAIAEMVIGLSKRLTIHSVVEGVETEEQLNWAKLCRCDRVQGYLTGRPMPYEAFLEWSNSTSQKLEQKAMVLAD